MLSFLTERRRRSLREKPFPADWERYLEENVSHYGDLSEDERSKLRGDVQVFLAEKWWEGCGGLTLTDEMKVTIAAQACLLVLAFAHDFYPNVETILVYPSGFRARMTDYGPGGIVTEGHSHRLGEAWQTGPIVLSWSDTVAGSRNPEDGHNVVFHEFAHKLDMLDGEVDGTPRLSDADRYPEWGRVMTGEFEALWENVQEGRATLLGDYAATNSGEFFAVATECFFEKPRALRRRHPDLYDVLRAYYRQDPAARVTARLRDRYGTGEEDEDME